ncbi:putative RNA-directed DNA polymerase [Rosa chinensis]|uniref:Putative RNA-directed DNA polymerase n=1 Tax=Rosa chinensis TaxID=74649 RepID=A0A2P6PSU6_ROSCH|nr:putative RNA-directed DNA polymerase [Rosa chinensis]
MLGDFNCVLGAHEKRGGNVPNAIACRDFQQMCTSCGMLDIDTKGVFYTWSNGRTDVRLDRAFGNSDWFEAWATIECRALTKASSDHHPIMVSCSRLNFIPHAPFRFQGMWLQHPGFLAMVRDFWTSLAVYGCPMYILATKLRALKAMLKAWNITSFGDINQRVKASRATLDSVQQEISDLGPTEDRIRCEEMATLSYQTDLSLQESFLRSKARVRWLIEGDRNTAFLHNLVKIRRVHKSLTSIKVGSQVFHGQDQISQQVVHHFEALFRRDSTITDTGLVNRTIPALVTEAENLSLTTRPTVEEIHEAVLNLDGSSAPGPDGFGGIFFQQCWEVVALDVIAAVTSFFVNGFILPHFNSSLIILVPKKDEADSISDYRPIALANFTFKVITKILADRLGLVASRIVSSNQSGFIKGRSIADPIILTSECVNLLDRESKWGNLAIKLDISKAFDTLDWAFLLRVLQAFGFAPTFISWIHRVLQSAWLSVQINGNSCGFFQCSRGVRQGDPLSPLLFCLAEEVLSRGLSKMVSKGKIYPIAAPRRVNPPSHVLFADDVMVFMQGNPRSLRALMKFLEEYAINSGQVVNKNKSSVFLGKYAQRRKVFIQHVLGIREGSLPFTYLGVPIFKGCPKPSYFRAIADKVRCNLSSWKGKQLSQAARLQLISSVTQSQLLHSFQVYSWPRPLLLKVQQWTRNFFWSGDPLKKGLALIAWDTCCRPLDQGGLGLKNLFHFNRALLLKNCWNIVNSSSSSAAFLRARFFSSDLCLLQYYQRSSVWPGFKKLWDSFYASVQWLVGDGSRISFWSDNWLGTPISSMHRITPVVRSLMPVKVSDFIRDKQWAISSTFNFFFPDLASRISKVVLPLENGVDQVIWPHNAAGVLTSKEAFDFISPPKPKVNWCKLIWNKALQPRKSLVAWKVLNKRILTDDWLVRRGIYLCSQCSICRSQGESLHHLFFDCSLVHEFWVWLASFFRIRLLPGASLVDLISPDTFIGLASSSKILWTFAFCNALWCIWTERNKIRFQEATFNLARFKHWFLTSLKESASIHFMPCSNASSMQGLFAVLGLSSLTVKAPKYVPVQWIPPPIQWLKVNTDGSFRSIEMAGFGGIFRDHEGHFRGAFAQKVEAPCAIDAEVLAVIEAMRIAWAKSWTHIWLETDSILVVQYFTNPTLIPWRLRIAWYNCLYLTRMIHFKVSHTFREGNTVADALANHGALNEGYSWWDDVPTFIARPYGRDLSSMINYRFR